MKRIKLLPSIMMLVLCVGILCVGIYAATPISANISGAINITAATGINVALYKDSVNGEQIERVSGTANINFNLETVTLDTDNNINPNGDTLLKYVLVVTTHTENQYVIDTETIQTIDGSVSGTSTKVEGAVIVTKNHKPTEGSVDTNGRPCVAKGKPYYIEITIKAGDPSAQAVDAELNIDVEIFDSTDTTAPEEINGIDYLYYGEYPQSYLADISISTMLYDWTSMGNWYAYDDAGCDSGYFDEYGFGIMGSGSTDTDGQKTLPIYCSKNDPELRCVAVYLNNGYASYSVYKLEPLKWRILERDPETGRTLLMCDTIVEQVCFRKTLSGDYAVNSSGTITVGDTTISGVYAGDYKYSDLRTYLNKTFYNNAFNTAERGCLIVETDYIFALSYEAVSNADYGFTATTRHLMPTDFAVVTGMASEIVDTGGLDQSWWTSSSFSIIPGLAGYIDHTGAPTTANPSYTVPGAVPAIILGL